MSLRTKFRSLDGNYGMMDHVSPHNVLNMVTQDRQVRGSGLLGAAGEEVGARGAARLFRNKCNAVYQKQAKLLAKSADLDTAFEQSRGTGFLVKLVVWLRGVNRVSFSEPTFLDVHYG